MPTTGMAIRFSGACHLPAFFERASQANEGMAQPANVCCRAFAIRSRIYSRSGTGSEAAADCAERGSECLRANRIVVTLPQCPLESVALPTYLLALRKTRK